MESACADLRQEFSADQEENRGNSGPAFSRGGLPRAVPLGARPADYKVF